MNPLPLLLRGLLALALLVPGLPTFATSHVGHGNALTTDVANTVDTPCHDPAPEPATETSDCCDRGGPACGCDCLQAAPALGVAGVSPGSVPAGSGPPAADAGAAPRASFAPSLRPPIA